MYSITEKCINEINVSLKKCGVNFVVDKVFDFGDSYLVCVGSPNNKNADFILDPFFLFNKKSRKTFGFSPTMNIEAFKKAMKSKPLYERKE